MCSRTSGSGTRGKDKEREAGERFQGRQGWETLDNGSPVQTWRWPLGFPVLCPQVLTGRMLLFWGSLLCWGLLPQAQGEARHQILLRISKDQLKTGKFKGWALGGKSSGKGGGGRWYHHLASPWPAAEWVFFHPYLTSSFPCSNTCRGSLMPQEKLQAPHLGIQDSASPASSTATCPDHPHRLHSLLPFLGYFFSLQFSFPPSQPAEF